MYALVHPFFTDTRSHIDAWKMERTSYCSVGCGFVGLECWCSIDDIAKTVLASKHTKKELVFNGPEAVDRACAENFSCLQSRRCRLQNFKVSTPLLLTAQEAISWWSFYTARRLHPMVELDRPPLFSSMIHLCDFLKEENGEYTHRAAGARCLHDDQEPSSFNPHDLHRA